ncbi:hypothetical protein GGR52DRAFT_583691 [Hypoxylon sp. FL1284]|nr:hypothetical protein GGR52DRAFT_583691 [Hypoxylon sp. FL1284]
MAALVSARVAIPLKTDHLFLPDPEYRTSPVHVKVTGTRRGGAEPPPSNQQQGSSAPNERPPNEPGDNSSSGNGSGDSNRDRDGDGDGNEDGPPEASSASSERGLLGRDDRTWYCSACYNGPFLITINPACADCGRDRSPDCPIEPNHLM